MAVNPYLDLVGEGQVGSCSPCQTYCPTGATNVLQVDTCPGLDCNNDGGESGAGGGCTPYSVALFDVLAQCEPNGSWSGTVCGDAHSGRTTSIEILVHKNVTLQFSYKGSPPIPTCMTVTVLFQGFIGFVPGPGQPPATAWISGLFGCFTDTIFHDGWQTSASQSFTVPLLGGVGILPLGGYSMYLKKVTSSPEDWQVNAIITLS